MNPLLETSVGPIHYRDYGGSGEIIVLVHGLGGSVINWDAIGPPLAVRGRVLALDLPGFGLSPPGQDWELSTHADAVVAFADEFSDSFTLVGNSLGALLSEIIASKHPTRVDRLALISPATPPRFPDPAIHWPTAIRLLIQATPAAGTAVSKYLLGRYTSEELVRLTLESVAHKPANIPMGIVEDFIRLAETRRSFPWAVEGVPKTGTAIARMFRKPRNFVSMIREIKAPTLVIHGIEDTIVSPTSVEWLCSLRPDWVLHQLEETGHVPQLDAPVRLLNTLQPWLVDQLMTESSA